MRIATTEEAIAAIEAARTEAPGGALAFDGDGTLWSGDVGEDFFDAVVDRGLARPETRAALEAEARAGGLGVDGDPSAIARRIHEAYVAGRFPEERTCEIMTWISAGFRMDELAALCEEIIASVGLAGRLHRETVAVVEHARRAGVEVYLVSASPRSIVLAAAKVVGIANVVAAEEQVVDGVVTPAVHRPIPYGPGKVTRLRERLGARPIYAAFGDNAFDVPMLQEARHAFAVRPKERLRARAAEVVGLAELAAVR